MFSQHPRVGFACKIQEEHDTPLSGFNIKSTTIKWLESQSKDRAVERLWDLAKTNLDVLKKQIEWVGKLPAEQRMFRLSSDILVAYTHPDWEWFYHENDVMDLLDKKFKQVGDRARELDVRLSFHPGQFCVLASENPEVVDRSLQEFEYHCDIIRYMGYGREFQDFKCNVHIGGKLGPEGIKQAVRSLSREARNVLTIENAEFSWGIDASLELAETCALVLDIHHHWIMSGEYIEPNDSRVQRMWESWRGVRPVIHYSLSRENVVVDHDPKVQPNLNELLKQGFTRAKLRAHSDYYWNERCNQWAMSFLPYADIMLEAKEKNLAQQGFAKQLKYNLATH
jgi:UV DNA damage repair endonuclease